MSLIYPLLPSGHLPDSSKFSESTEDVAMRDETDGGYTITRARHTRPPRKTWRVGYTWITGEDKTVLDDFYVTARGGSRAFDWTNPENGLIYKVRFKGKLEWTYRGIREVRRWDCSFELEQA